MGYVSVMGECIGCRRVFSFSPTKVPSVIVNGVREPICEACVIRANPMRQANGLPLIEVKPGAYEPDDESEVPWD
jgi:hypothetical protein